MKFVVMVLIVDLLIAELGVADKCGVCLVAGLWRVSGSWWLSSNCTLMKECNDGEVSTGRYKCPVNSACQGGYCQCQDGYEVDDHSYGVVKSCKPLYPIPEVPCPDGWTSKGGFCYLLLSDQKENWYEARSACQRLGADLVTIPDIHTYGLVTALLNDDGGQFWLGLNDVKHDGYYHWLDEYQEAEFTSWVPQSDLKSPRNAECVFMDAKADYQCRNIACTFKLSPLCQRKPSNQTGEPIPECQEGWHSYAGNCYQLFKEKLVWPQAKEQCTLHGGYLTQIPDAEIHGFLSALIKAQSDVSDVWIGLSDSGIENDFVWEPDHSPVRLDKLNEHTERITTRCVHFHDWWL